MSSPISISAFEDVFKSQPEYIYENTFDVGTNDNLLTDEQITRMLEYYENKNSLKISLNNSLKNYIYLFILFILLILFFSL